MQQINYNTTITPQVQQILLEFKQAVVQKYPVLEMCLFGSTARGETTQYSDIDILLRLPEVNRTIEEDLFDIAYEFELKYDCLIDVIILADSLLKTHAAYLPIYQNILHDGVLI